MTCLAHAVSVSAISVPHFDLIYHDVFPLAHPFHATVMGSSFVSFKRKPK